MILMHTLCQSLVIPVCKHYIKTNKSHLFLLAVVKKAHYHVIVVTGITSTQKMRLLLCNGIEEHSNLHYCL